MSNQNKVNNILTISLNNYKDLLKTGKLGNYTYNPADVFAWDMYDVINKSIQWDAASLGVDIPPYVYANDQAESYWWKIQPGMKHEDLDQYFTQTIVAINFRINFLMLLATNSVLLIYELIKIMNVPFVYSRSMDLLNIYLLLHGIIRVQ